MFAEVRKTFPEISRWVENIYGSEAHLNHGDTTIKSKTGLHQGDPLAVLLYAVAAHPVVLRVKEEVPNLKQNAWFLDDGALAGNREDLKKVVDIIKEEGPQRGLNLSTEKSKVWCQEPKNDDNPLQQEIPLKNPLKIAL